MHTLVSLATTAALLLHITLGCGVQHVHAATPCSSHAHAEEAGCSHNEPVEPASHHDDDCAPEPCDDLKCSFVQPAPTTTPLGSDLSFGWINVPEELASATLFPCQTAWLSSELTTSAPPLRAHLLHQVILI
jgi:hypothetical protein